MNNARKFIHEKIGSQIFLLTSENRLETDVKRKSEAAYSL